MNRMLMLLACLLLGLPSYAADGHTTWRSYGGSPDGAQYSALHQINRSNVRGLQVAWTFRTGDGRKYAFNPLVVDRTMYVLAKDNSIVALDAATGKEIWTHPTDANTTLITNRGLNYWQSADGSDRRLLFSLRNQLQELDARTGKAITDFGTHGVVDLREGLGRDAQSLTLVQSYNPGRVFEDLLILGSATNEEYRSGPGRHSRLRCAQLAAWSWSFHTSSASGGSRATRPGPKMHGSPWAGANDWSGMALDEGARASSMCPQPARNTIFTAPIDRAS